MLLDSECRRILSVVHVVEVRGRSLVEQVAYALGALHMRVLLIKELSHSQTVCIHLQIVL